MGLSHLSYWMSWMITVIVLVTLLTSIMIGSGWLFQFDLFVKTSSPILFVLFFTFGLAV